MSDPLGGLSPQAPEPEAPRAVQTPPKRPFTPTTYALLLVFAVFFAIEGLIARDWSVESSVALVRLGALYFPAVRSGDWWRLGAYAFLHIGWMHIAANSWSLWVLAPQMEMTFGSNLTMGMFAFTALAGGAASTIWNLELHRAVLGAGASGGIMGLFGATIALFWRIRERIPPETRRRILRAIGLNVFIMVAIAFYAPVDNAAHAGGALSGIALGLLAPLKSRPQRPWHKPAQWLIIGSALGLAAMEGAAVAWAVRPKPRTLHGAGIEAQIPGMLMPSESGVALLPGAAYLEIRREDLPLQIVPGEDAVRIGDRTWVREHDSREGTDITLLAAADGAGRLIIEFGCGSDFCKGAAGEAMYQLPARTIKVVH